MYKLCIIIIIIIAYVCVIFKPCLQYFKSIICCLYSIILYKHTIMLPCFLCVCRKCLEKLICVCDKRYPCFIIIIIITNIKCNNTSFPYSLTVSLVFDIFYSK